MAIEPINLNTTNEFLTMDAKIKNDKKKTNPLVQKGKELGINVEQFYIYNEKNECVGIDTVKLNAAIQESKSKKDQDTQTPNYDLDSFVTSNEKITKAEKKEKAKDFQAIIDDEYTDAALKYADSLNQHAYSTTKEGKLADAWDSIQADANKLTSFTASNTTVLEGVKEFVTNLTNLINSTKNYNAEKATEKDSYFSLETIRDIEDKNNAIEVYGTNIFNSNPFKSAFGTFSEEEYEMAV